MNPVTDVNWECMFPIKIGSINIMNSSYPDPPDCISGITCFCPTVLPPFVRYGVPFSWWKCRRLFEIVKDSYCFPSLGGISIGGGGNLGGSQSGQGNQDDSIVFFQAHFMTYAPFDVLGMQIDSMCFQNSETLVNWMTEFDIMWNDDELAAVLTPGAGVYANSTSQLAGIADSAAANVYLPVPAIYWYMGSWGSVFPLSGRVGTDQLVNGSAALAGRMIFKMCRSFSILDSNIYPCFAVPTFSWIKWHYRLQAVRPLVGNTCFPIGRSPFLWGVGQSAPSLTGSDNFVYMLFQKQTCCAW